MCFYAFDELIKEKNISLEEYEGIEYNKTDEKGNCEKNYFTPDGEKCYKCNNEKVGMPGCKGECSFSWKRQNSLLCESGCEEGYLESSKGICEPCEEFEKGCSQCYYDKNFSYTDSYFSDSFGTGFVCNNCIKGFSLRNGECYNCSRMIRNCEECLYDEDLNQEMCTKCSKNYIIEEDGECQRCILTETIINDKCVSCSNTSEGGVENCLLCQNNKEGNGILCNECEEGYILLTNDNTYLKRENNKELESFEKCLELKSENGKYICSRWKPQYSLLKNGSELQCSFTPELFDFNFEGYYYDHYYYDVFNGNRYNYEKFAQDDYTFRQSMFLPCKESINLGTNENPLYSCSKC